MFKVRVGQMGAANLLASSVIESKAAEVCVQGGDETRMSVGEKERCGVADGSARSRITSSPAQKRWAAASGAAWPLSHSGLVMRHSEPLGQPEREVDVLHGLRRRPF